MNQNTTVSVNIDDAVEIIDALGFVRDWLSCDPEQLAVSLNSFCAGYSLNELHRDLGRLADLLAQARTNPAKGVGQ